jgi:hypothetical protein
MRSREETIVKAKEQLNEQVSEKVSWSEADRRVTGKNALQIFVCTRRKS